MSARICWCGSTVTQTVVSGIRCACLKAAPEQLSSTTSKAVCLLTVSWLVASAAISVGNFVTTTTGGKGLAATTANQLCLGYAISASTADGQVIELLMTGPFRYSST